MLTPADVENKVFKKAKIGGYDINDVEDFLEKLIVDFEAVCKANINEWMGQCKPQMIIEDCEINYIQ